MIRLNSSISSPFHPYHLYRNPFGELSRTERVELAVMDEEHWLSKLPKPGGVLQLIGDCGHGKTTHLLALHQLIPKSIYVYLPEDGPFPSIPSYRPLIIDESQRLNRKQLHLVLKQGGELILGTHADHAQAIERYGLQVATVIVAELLTSQHLTDILNRRIQASALSSSGVTQLTHDQADQLRLRFGSNIREIEHYLYEQFQTCVREKKLWPPTFIMDPENEVSA